MFGQEPASRRVRQVLWMHSATVLDQMLKNHVPDCPDIACAGREEFAAADHQFLKTRKLQSRGLLQAHPVMAHMPKKPSGEALIVYHRDKQVNNVTHGRAKKLLDLVSNRLQFPDS